MSLSSSLSAGVSGLLTNSARLATISDNIANSSTNGYKRADLEFAALVNASSSGGFSAGGVRGVVYRDVASAGSLIGTTNPTDLAVGGNGMLPVTETDRQDLPAGARPFLLTPTGSFSIDDEGFLTTKTGLTLLGYRLDRNGNLPPNIVRTGPDDLSPIQVSNDINAAQETSEIKLGVNLPASQATGAAVAPVILTSPIQYFDSLGRSNTLTVQYVHDPAGLGHGPNQWQLQIFDSGSAGNADPAGDPPLTTVDLNFDDTNSGLFTPGGVGAPAGPGAVGYDPATGNVTINVANDLLGPNAPIQIDLFIGSDDPAVMGTLTDLGLTQLDAEFAPTNVLKNGAAAGTLAGLEVDERGVLLGIYDTGQRVPLYQIPIADVPNFNGLQALDNQTFALSPASGNVFLHDASTGPVGSLESFALQQSTVDVAEELTNLIQTQRAYSSNATVIQTVDEMLQETTNLKR